MNLEDILFEENSGGWNYRSDWNNDKIILWSKSAGLDSFFSPAINYAFDLISKYTGLTFQEVTDGYHEISFSKSYDIRDSSGTELYATTDQTTYPLYLLGEEAKVLFDSKDFNSSSQAYVGSFLYYASMHEILHALGAGHVFDTDYNSGSKTVMSYRFQNQSVDTLTLAPSTYSPIDILTMQAWYGVNQNFSNTANSYQFDQNSGFETIYDTGGTDSISLANANGPTLLDLRPGFVSQINGNSTFALAFSGETVQQAMTRVGTEGSVAGLDTRIENATGSGYADDIVGNTADNTLNGLDGNDRIYGGTGNDILVGGRGNDVLVGNYLGVPNGAYSVADALAWGLYNFIDPAGEMDTADYSAGRDGNSGMTTGITVNLSLTSNQVTNDGFGGKDTLIGIEKIIGTAMGDTFTGGAMTFEFFGEGGDDKFNASSGAERFDGGAGSDTVNYSSSTAGVTVHFDGTTGTGGDAAGDTLNLIEKVIGSAEIDTIYMADNGNTYGYGGNKNDIFYGGDNMGGTFYNEIRGEAGNDTFYYRGGQAYFVGGAGGERNKLDLSMTGLTTADQGFTFHLAESIYQRYVDKIGQIDQKITLMDITEFVGSDGQDTFIVEGWGRSEGYWGGDGIDTLDLSKVTWGAGANGIGVNVYADFAQTNTGVRIAEIHDIEKFIGTDYKDFFVGSDQESWFYGGYQLDTFYAGSGIDHIDGGLHASNSIRDIVHYDSSTAAINVNLWSAGPQSGGFADGDTLVNIHTVYGSINHGDTISNSGSTKQGSVLYGQGGDDTLHLYASGTMAEGGADNDKLYAHGNYQTLVGGSGADEFHFDYAGFAYVTDYEAGEDIYIDHAAAGMSVHYGTTDGSVFLRWADGTNYNFKGQTSHILDDLFFV